MFNLTMKTVVMTHISGDSYPCQMQANQHFSCLFRHYAKHNGLNKEDLTFTFVDELQSDQTPDAVHLMTHDEIWVDHRKPVSDTFHGEAETEKTSQLATFQKQFQALLDSGAHGDITFVFANDANRSLLAHKAILSSRCEYFEVMFRVGGMSESLQSEISVLHKFADFYRLLQFLYTNTVPDLEQLDGEDLIALLILANEHLVQSLQTICEAHLQGLIDVDNVGRWFLLAAKHRATRLQQACAEYVQIHKAVLVTNAKFRAELEQSAELGVLVFEASLSPSCSLLLSEQSCWSFCLSNNTDVTTTANNPFLLSPIGNKRRRSSSDTVSDPRLDLVPPQLNGNGNGNSNSLTFSQQVLTTTSSLPANITNQNNNNNNTVSTNNDSQTNNQHLSASSSVMHNILFSGNSNIFSATH